MLKPTLYELDASGRPILLGGRCECGFVFFPMQSYGCERCGRSGSSLHPNALAASGKLVAHAVVHMHADVRRPTPFAIGTIALDDGPVIRTLLLDPSDPGLIAGAAVVGTLIPVTTSDDAPALDLRFTCPRNAT